MAIIDKEYSYSVDSFHRPSSVVGKDAIGSRLMQLITMEPGDDPLHPDMGVGLRTFRFGVDKLFSLKRRIETQIDTYLPFYKYVNVTIIQTPDKVCNLEITIDETKFIYDSANSFKPIRLDDLK